MAYELLTFQVADRIATITVDRAEKLNALNDALMAELSLAIDEAVRRPDVGAVLLTGAGRAFVAGADIGELVDQTATEGKARAERGQRTFRKFERSPKPTLAAVNGFALGGGCELAMACHIRVASDTAKFGQPEVKLGIVPGYGASQRLPRLVGKGRALQLLLTGEMIDAAEAYRIGLVNRVVAAADLLEAARALLTTILAQGPLAVALCIEAVDRGLDMPLDDAIALEASYFGVLSATEDKAEGMRAFLEKRPAQFKGK
ncbi:MAG: enoyl-CoA hydratase-related protein [Gemmatimonadaceae bacterium]